jgi:hypothetical protein
MIMERHYAYFIGFGFPYVILIKVTNFFIGYGLFLAAFPFMIILGGICDYKAPYQEQLVQPLPKNLPIFKAAQSWTLFVLKHFMKSIEHPVIKKHE